MRKLIGKGMLAKKILLVIILSAVTLSLSACDLEDWFNLNMINANVGVPGANMDFNTKSPHFGDFDFRNPGNYGKYNHNKKPPNTNLTKPPKIKNIYKNLGISDINNISNLPDMPKNLGSLNNSVNDLPAPTPAEDIEVFVSIECYYLERFDVSMYLDLSDDGIIISGQSITIKSGTSVNNLMSRLSDLVGKNIPVIIDSSGVITSINEIDNSNREEISTTKWANCYWQCMLGDIALTTKDYILKDGDKIVFEYQFEYL